MKISVTVKPRAREAKVQRTTEGYVVYVKEPPVDNKANKGLVTALARHFGLPKSAVRILSGHRSRRKRVEVEGVAGD